MSDCIKTTPHSCQAGKYRVEEVQRSNPRKFMMTWPEQKPNRIKPRSYQVWELQYKEVFKCPFCGEKASGEKA